MATYAKYSGMGGGGGTGSVTSVGLADGSSTPIFDITGSPVTSSGTLTETLKTQSANTVFAGPTSGGAAQPTFRALVPADIPAITGTANTFAGYDSSGFLYSDINMGINALGGINTSFSLNVDNTGGSQIQSWNQNFTPTVDSNDNWIIHNLNTNIDMSSGLDWSPGGNALTQLNQGMFITGQGGLGGVQFNSNNIQLGDGTNPAAVGGINYYTAFSNIQNNAIVSNYLQGYGFQPTFQTGSAVGSGFYISAFYDGAQFNNVASYSHNSFSSAPNLFQVSNNYNYNAFISNPNIATLQGNAGAYGFGFYPNITTVGANGNIVALNTNPTITTLGANASIQGVSLGGTVTTMGSSSNFNGFSWYPNITTSHGNLQGLQISPNISGGDAGFNGINISPQGGATLSNPVGININLSQINSTDPQGKTGIQSDARLQVNATSQLNSSLGFQIGSRLEHLFTVPLGSPVTGTDELGVNIAGDLLAQDDIANGTFGIGFNSVGFIASLAVAATKTVDTVTTFLPASALPDPGFTTGGTVTEFHMIRTFPPLPQGGTLNITNLYGFKIDSAFGPFSGAATNAWGLFIDDPSLGNYFAGNLAIGTSTTKVSNSSVALEIGGTTKAFRLSNLTTTQRNALTPLAGMEIFNTTTNAVEFYDGSSWTSSSGGISSIGTFDSQTPSADGLVISGTSLYAQSASATDPGMVNTSTQTFAGVKTFSSAPNLSSLTASLPLQLDASKNVISAAINLSGSQVTSALPIGNGGTGQTTKAAAFDALSPMTTAGDLIYGGASGTGTRLPVGSNGFFLTVSGGNPVWSGVSPGSPNSTIYVGTQNGYGSTNTQCARYTNVITSIGSDITYTDDASLGATFTINTTGNYVINVVDSGNPCYIGASVNTSNGATQIYNLPVSEIVAITIAQSNQINSCSGAVHLTAGDVVYAQMGGTVTGSADYQSNFKIVRVS